MAPAVTIRELMRFVDLGITEPLPPMTFDPSHAGVSLAIITAFDGEGQRRLRCDKSGDLRSDWLDSDLGNILLKIMAVNTNAVDILVDTSSMATLLLSIEGYLSSLDYDLSLVEAVTNQITFTSGSINVYNT